MDHKLTLKLDQSVIAKAKKYAHANEISLSRLFENYLLKITSEMDSKSEITPLVKSLSGIIEIVEDKDAREGYATFLAKKYS